MELKVKLYLTDNQGDKFMGIGVLWLLLKTKELGSLRKAAMSLNISYSKAHGMVKKLEVALKKDVILKQKGGSSREGSTLTEFGETFLSLYSSFQKEAKETIDLTYKDFLLSLEKHMEEKDVRTL